MLIYAGLLRKITEHILYLGAKQQLFGSTQPEINTAINIHLQGTQQRPVFKQICS